MRDGFKIIDTDAHMMEPESLWERYMEDAYKSQAPQIGKAPGSGRRAFLIEGESFVREKGKYPMAAPGFLKTVEKSMERFGKARNAGFSAESRLDDMDAQGVDVQILFPTVTGQMLGREFRDPKLLAACCRAYNNWAADYVSTMPYRLKWAAVLPMQDVEEAIKEAHRTAQNGCVSYFVRPNPVRGRTIWSDDYLPLWNEVERIGKPITTHDLASSSVPRLETGWTRTSAAIFYPIPSRRWPQWRV